MSVRLINPANGELLREIVLQNERELGRALNESEEAFRLWRTTQLALRLQSVSAFAEAMVSQRVPLAEGITREMGKTFKESLGEVDKCSESCRILIDEFPRWLAQAEYATPAGFRITRQPMGPLFGIMPWNFPLWQVVRFAIPAILCGNSILLKHAPNTWGVAELIEDLFKSSFPSGLYLNLRIDLEATSRVIADRRVRGVSLTGSRQAGSHVATQAGAAIKKCVLELGGSDAYVVLDDADVELAARVCAQSRLINAGQSCVSAKRFIVTKKNVDQFTESLRANLATKHFGDPMVKITDFGPMARLDLRDQLHAQVRRSVDAGAKLILGGAIPEHSGYFYPATMLTEVLPGHVAFDEELFGPVAAVSTASGETEAMELANRSSYGLGGAIFSRDLERAKHLATTEMEAGMVFVNELVRSDVTVPFGGIKDSGLGRELGRDGCLEFTNIKTVYIKPH